MELSTEDVVRLVEETGRPRVGIFVPDGSRRLVLAFTDAKPGTEEFHRLCATLPAQFLLESIKVFFDHGLPILLVPILSRSVLARGSAYRCFTALEGLKLLFQSEVWSSFYDAYDVRVKVYGEPDRLRGTECAESLGWIAETVERTAKHEAHALFYAIGESPWLGEDIAKMGIALYSRLGQIPTREEQIQEYYGEVLSPADFYIMTSKISGMGALPRLLVNGDTEVYFLPAAGAIGLNAKTYRLILHDLLCERSRLRGGTGKDISPSQRAALRDYFQKNANTVIGLGSHIGDVWVPEV